MCNIANSTNSAVSPCPCKCYMKDQRGNVACNCYKQQCCLVYGGLNCYKQQCCLVYGGLNCYKQQCCLVYGGLNWCNNNLFLYSK